MKRYLLFLLLVVSCISAMSQEQRSYITETDKYIVWQPGTKLTFEMFEKKDPTERDLQGMESDHRNSVPYLGFWRVLDIPKKKNGWKKGQKGEAYFCATFSKFQSYMAVPDTFELQLVQAQWDLCELGTRVSRMFLDSLQTLMGPSTTGIAESFFTTSNNCGKDAYLRLSYEFLRDVVLPKDHEKYQKYRIMLDGMLDATSEFATRPEEAERLLLKKPTKKHLKQAKEVEGNLE